MDQRSGARTRVWTGWLAAFGLGLATSAFGTCTIAKLAELPVIPTENNRPLIEGQINGRTVKILVDTGTEASFIREQEVNELGLKTVGLSYETDYGAGGAVRLRAASVNDLRFGQFQAKNVQLRVFGPQHPGRGSSDVPMVLGEDFLSQFVTEFDLAHGAIRLLRLEHCKAEQVAYWATTYSLADLNGRARIEAEIKVNGKPVQAVFDSGAATSVLALSAVKRLGIDLDSGPALGTVSGIDGNPMEVRLATFDTLAIGDESVRNGRLRVADIFSADTKQGTGTRIRRATEEAEMVVGADFFRSHRILVMYAERKMVFTYNGGPIFQTAEQRSVEK